MMSGGRGSFLTPVLSVIGAVGCAGETQESETSPNETSPAKRELTQEEKIGAGWKNGACAVRPETPWHKYDRFDANGVEKPNGQIDMADLEAWASNYPKLSENDRAFVIPKAPQTFCGLFRVDLLREQFLETFARPEENRKNPRPPLEAWKTKVAVQEGSRKAKKAINEESELLHGEVNTGGPCGASFYGLDMVALAKKDPIDYRIHKDLCPDLIAHYSNFEIGILEKLQMAELQILDSLVQPEGELFGVGIHFLNHKKGEYVWIQDIATSSEEARNHLAQNGVKAGMQILAIDGTSTKEMDFWGVYHATRGPKDSEATLTVQEEGKDPFDVTIRRTFTPATLR